MSSQFLTPMYTLKIQNDLLPLNATVFLTFVITFLPYVRIIKYTMLLISLYVLLTKHQADCFKQLNLQCINLNLCFIDTILKLYIPLPYASYTLFM